MAAACGWLGMLPAMTAAWSYEEMLAMVALCGWLGMLPAITAAWSYEEMLAMAAACGDDRGCVDG